MTEPAAIYRTGIPLRCPLCRQDGLTIAGSVAACPACGLKRQADEHAVFDLSAEVATDEAIQREKYDELLQGGTQASDPLRHFVSPQGLQKVRMLRRLGLRPGQRFLEAGCGAGPLSQAFGQYLGATGVAIDISPASVRAQLARRGQGAHFDALVASATNLPFPDATFDASVALDIAEHMARPEQLYAELARVTKPGGRALFAISGAGFREHAGVDEVSAVARSLADPDARRRPLPG